MDAKVVRGMYEGSDHYTILIKIEIRGGWQYGKRNDKVKGRQVVASDRLDRKEQQRAV